MRLAAVTLAALAAAGCAGRSSPDSTSPTADLQISISIRGPSIIFLPSVG